MATDDVTQTAVFRAILAVEAPDMDVSTPTRRDALKLLGVAGALGLERQGEALQTPTATTPLDAALTRNAAAVRTMLAAQVTDTSSRVRGGLPDPTGLHHATSAGGAIETFAAAFIHPRSVFRGDPVLLERIRLAAGFLERFQSPQGNIDLLTTNFNSPPDTGFVVHNVATAAAIGRAHGAPEIARALQSFLVKGGAGMASGGVHTPNHRWVISAALAQIHDLFPDDRYVRRIDEWLAEGIDIDSDGQFTERSTLTYNIVTNRALIVTASKLGRPALLEPVRRNLRALTWLLHADGEVVTEISRRQDQYTRGGVNGYWFSLTYMAVTDRDGQFATLARQAALEGARLSTLLEYPEVSAALPQAQSLPDDFERAMPAIGITRIRRGPASTTLILGGSSRLLTFRHGDAVVEGVRFATAFFGKGQFIPAAAAKEGGRYVYRQTLEAPYYQPLAETITTDTWGPSRGRRRQSEVCRLEQSATVTEIPDGLEIRLQATGTDGVPLAVEIALREGGGLEGVQPVEGLPDCFVVEQGTATYRRGRSLLRIGPGVAPHRYVQVRGAEPRLPGQSLYITGFTPFDRTIRIEGA
jgi:hypothetical protein